jgi:hypothetical protein
MDMTSNRSIQNIVRYAQPSLSSKRLPLKQLKAIDAIATCRTTDAGISVYECDDKHKPLLVKHACKHRSCCLCAARRRNQWVEQQKSRLLDCAHFHCVFTLPSEFHTLWLFNQKWFSSTFFSVVRSVLFDLMKDEKHQGVTPGVLMAMHTWGRQLNLHPHIHCVVTAGGVDDAGRWKDSGDYLLPVRVVRALYKGRFRAAIRSAIEADELNLPADYTRGKALNLVRMSARKTWCVRIEEQYAHGRGVLLYLSRYLRGGPIHPKQIVRSDADRIGFRYKDHRDKRIKELNLRPAEFIRRLMLHVPETGQHMVRHYGLYASAAKGKRNQCREVIGGLMESMEAASAAIQPAKLLCSDCGAVMRLKHSYYIRASKGNSIKEESDKGHVQQVDEADKTLSKKTPPPLRL